MSAKLSPDKNFFRTVRDCNCADPENCTQAVPGYRCKAGRTIWIDDGPHRLRMTASPYDLNGDKEYPGE